jgi:uncharacterized sulfatase
MKLHRLPVLLVAAVLSYQSARAEDPTKAAPAPVPLGALPSIILIQCHGLGYGDLSCYGQTNYQSPTLDRLAAEGVRFTQYFANNIGSEPSPGAMMFGKISAPTAGELTLAQRLQQAGYHTGLIGEWGLGTEPWQQGFDEFAGFVEDSEGQNYFADYLWRYAPRSILNPTNNQLETFAGKEPLHDNTNGRKGQYLPELLINAACNFIRNNQPDNANQNRPFFLLANLSAPRSASYGLDNFPVPSDAPFTSEKWPQAAKDRAALIARLDGNVARVLKQLTDLGLTNNVAVIFTSMAPPQKFADPKLAEIFTNQKPLSEKEKLTAPLPLIVRWPGNVSTGQVRSLACSALDLAPTLLQMAHQPSVTNYAGISILQLAQSHPGTNTPALPADRNNNF